VFQNIYLKQVFGGRRFRSRSMQH